MVGVVLLVFAILVLGMIAMVGQQRRGNPPRDPRHSGSW